ncbi:MAG: hypothetical protein JXR25_09400 [Pontiellaceae bacterium]|nr:hypothetical protein [Pontiellaceae bacterium]MBN2785031.1 hypothetical protein [Pontiellaceae bacterium]
MRGNVSSEVQGRGPEAGTAAEEHSFSSERGGAVMMVSGLRISAGVLSMMASAAIFASGLGGLLGLLILHG